MARRRQRPARVTASKQKTKPNTVEVARRQPKKLDMTVAIVVPTMQHLLTSSTSILHAELAHLMRMVHKNKPLTGAQSQKFARYVTALKHLADEDRSQRKEGREAELSDDELINELLEDPEFINKLRLRLAGGDGDG